jgi:hypothetical protein
LVQRRRRKTLTDTPQSLGAFFHARGEIMASEPCGIMAEDAMTRTKLR